MGVWNDAYYDDLNLCLKALGVVCGAVFAIAILGVGIGLGLKSTTPQIPNIDETSTTQAPTTNIPTDDDCLIKDCVGIGTMQFIFIISL